jgi:hypothetical protein
MKLRVAKGVSLARSCAAGVCQHRWSTIVAATRLVQRAVRRGTRLVAFRDLSEWSDEDRAAARPGLERGCSDDGKAVRDLGEGIPRVARRLGDRH